METSDQSSSGTSPPLIPICIACSDDHLALYRCLECNESYCEFMATAHMRMKTTRAHQVISIQTDDLQSVICKDHKDISKYYDIFCNRLVCRDCVVLDHMGHKCIGLDSGRKNLEKKLTDCQSRSIESIMLLRKNLKSAQEESMELDEQFKDCESLLQADFDQIIEVLKRTEVAMHTSLTAAYANQKSILTNHCHSLSSAIDHEEANWTKLEKVTTTLHSLPYNKLHNIEAIQLLTKSLPSMTTLPSSNHHSTNTTHHTPDTSDNVSTPLLSSLMITKTMKEQVLLCIETFPVAKNTKKVVEEEAAVIAVTVGEPVEETAKVLQPVIAANHIPPAETLTTQTLVVETEKSHDELKETPQETPQETVQETAQETAAKTGDEGSSTTSFKGLMCSAAGDHLIKLWHPVTGSCLQTFTGHTGRVRCVLQLQDGTRLASGGDDSVLKVWDMSTMSCLQTLVGHTSLIYSITQLSTGHLCSASFDHTIKVWDISGHPWTCVQTCVGHLKEVFRVIEWCSCPSMSEMRMLVSGSADSTIKVWDVRTGQCVQTLSGHVQPVVALLGIPTTTHLVSGSEDHTMKVWDMATTHCLQTLVGHTSRVTSVILRQDGGLLSTSCDMSMKVWQLVSYRYECVVTLQGHTAYVLTVCELSDGSLWSGSTDTTIKVWTHNDDSIEEEEGSEGDGEGRRRGYTCMATLTEHTHSVSSIIQLR